MTHFPFPEDWQTRWHAAGSADALGEGEVRELRADGRVLRVTRIEGELSAASDGRELPVMVVDDEIYVFLGDVPG